MKDKIAQEIERFLRQHGDFESLDEAMALAQGYVNQRNAQADPELGGLSPDQVYPLVNLPWHDPKHPMQLNQGLNFSRLSSIKFLKNARLFLSELLDDTKPNVTATGNLNRRFVGQIVERLDLEPGLLDKIKSYNKVINEPDVNALHVVRIVCEEAGLIRLRAKSYQVVKKHQVLLQETNIGKLFALLFETYFTKFNLGFCDGFPDHPSIQACIPFTLAQLAKRANQWQDLPALDKYLLLPMAREELAEARHPRDHDDLFFLELRILQHLEAFGLVECEREQRTKYTTKISRLRKTKLFDQFISFMW